MVYIQAGILSKFVDAVKQLSDSFSKLLSHFDDYGLEVTKQETLKDGSLKMWCKYGSKPFGMILSSVEGSDKVTIKIHIDGKDTELKNINEFDVENTVKKTLSKLLKIEFSNGANSAKNLSVTLHKIISNDTIDIRLTAINANCTIEDANNMLNTALDSDEFIESLTETPTSFSITDVGDAYCIDTISSVDKLSAIDNVIREAYKLYLTGMQLYFLSSLYKDMLTADTMRSFAEQMQIYFMNLCCIRNTMAGTSSPIATYISTFPDIVRSESLSSENLNDILQDALLSFIDCVEFNSPNFDFESQSIISQLVADISHYRTKNLF